MGYRIGIDVGDQSVGLAAVEYDANGKPLRILAAVSHIHDGGLDPETAKSPLSRVNTSGVARRTRRLLRKRRKRLVLLDRVLSELGVPVPVSEVPQTHDVWRYRDELSRAYEPDDAKRLFGVSMVVRHMARHRGWRNPWWTWSTLRDAVAPSANFVETRAGAVDRFGPHMAEMNTMGQMVMAMVATGESVRDTKRSKARETKPLMTHQVSQVDTLHELRLILSMQKFDDAAIEKICAAVFHQAAPHVPAERIGRCSILPEDVRAPRASLEFQEYRIRAAVGNLRFRNPDRALTGEQYDQVVKFLMQWRQEDRPRWSDVAELLEVSPRHLNDPSIDDMGGSGAVCDATSRDVEKHFKKKSAVRKWWDGASREDRAEFVDYVTDVTGNDTEPEAVGLAEILEDDNNLADIEKLTIRESGRAAYGRRALELMNVEMRTHRCDVHEARKRAFGFADDWQPPKPSFDDEIDHPGVARVNTIVRRFLMTATQKWGTPESVSVEHVRSAFMGPTGRAEYLGEVRRNTYRREQKAKELVQQGFERPSDADIRRLESLNLQQGMCLYCGKAISMKTCELDHIIPRAAGGGNTRDNLVAVCRECNNAKGRTPFAVWAKSRSNPDVKLEEARERVMAFNSEEYKGRRLFRLRADVSRRLGMETDDSDGMDRSIESTAYAAREMRRRIENFLGIDRSSIADDDAARVHVFQGLVTSEARKAGEIDGILKLRNISRSKRMDRRHHAIDAAVLTCVTPGAARTLKYRGELRNDSRMVGDDNDWRNWAGRTAGEIASFKAWQESMKALGSLLADAVAADRVPVVRPLRLTPRIGSIHKDTIEKLVSKPLSEAFGADDFERVVDPRLYVRLKDLADGADVLPADPLRHEKLELSSTYVVKLFPSSAAYIAVRGGAAKIGDSIKHARVYAWRTKDGFGYGMVRVYGAEFPAIGFLKSGVDILTAPLPRESQSMRHANPALVKRIESGEAKCIGWIAIDDELEIDAQHFSQGTGKISQFLKEADECHWTVTGFFDDTKISIAPALLASEGIDDLTPEAVSTVLKDNRIPTAVNVLLADASLKVLRRSVTGVPRWNTRGLPASWSPRDAALKAFAE